MYLAQSNANVSFDSQYLHVLVTDDDAFQTALAWPETQKRIQALLKRGLQRESDFENRWPALLDTLLET